MATLQERIIGSLRLDTKTFEEVEADQNATGQAFIVVVLAALASGIGSIRAGMGVVAISLVVALIGWVVWSLLTFIIGTKVLPEKDTRADLGQMLRVLGFAQAPGLFSILGIIPILGYLIRFGIFIWMLAAVVIAVRQALDYTSTARAVAVCVIGWVVYLIITMMFGGMAMFGAAMAR